VVGKAHPNNFEVFEVMKEHASSEMKLEQLELKRRDLLRRANRFQHCLSDLSRDNTALAIPSNSYLLVPSLVKIQCQLA